MKSKISSILIFMFFTICTTNAGVIKIENNSIINNIKKDLIAVNYRKSKKKKIIGKASYYSDKYQRRRTASGEKYKKRKKTAAHRTLPFGTKVRVKNLANGKSVKVKINDRGPFVRGREIDLSKKAFSKIGNLKSGVLNVEITVLN